MSLETAELRSISSSLSLVRLSARVGGRSIGEFPLVGPVSVDIAADAGVSAHSLSILTPETISSLGIVEAVRIDNGRDVEVKFVDKTLYGRIGGVLGKKLPREVSGEFESACVLSHFRDYGKLTRWSSR